MLGLLHELPGAAMNKIPHPGWLTQQKSIVSWLQRLQVQSQGVVRVGSLGDFKKKICSLLLSPFQVALRVPDLYMASLPYLYTLFSLCMSASCPYFSFA